MNQPATSTGAIAVTAGAQSVTGTGVLLSVECDAGSAAGTVTVYDGTSTDGLLLCNLKGVAIGTTQIADFAQGTAFNVGLFVVVTGTASVGVIRYRQN